MYNPQIKEKHTLIDLTNYGTESRKSIHSNVLIGTAPPNPMFREGDILDGNATLNLILGAYNEGKVFEVFSKEGLKISGRLDNIEASISENDNTLTKRIQTLESLHNNDTTRLNSKISTIEQNIPNLKRVVDITLQSEEGGKKTYLVEKQNGTGRIIIKDGEKGDKGDPFTFDDFTQEQLNTLKVKGDKGDIGTGISNIKQTTISYTDGGVNVVTITLDDGSKSEILMRNGHGVEIAKEVLDAVLQLKDEALYASYSEPDETMFFTHGVEYDDDDETLFIAKRIPL